MCTIITLHEAHDWYPLIVATNRDEAHDRPSEPPDLLRVLPLAVMAPKDLRRGGTWMGAAQGGWFVGLTNQETPVIADDKLSRGDVVRRCLEACDHREACRVLDGLNRDDYNPFNLVFGRPGSLFLARVAPGRPLELEPIGPGVRAISNDCWGQAYDAKVSRAEALASRVGQRDTRGVVLRKLAVALADHANATPDPYQSLCVHDDVRRFGTRSSAILLFSNSGDVTYYHSEGPACSTRGYTFCRRLHHLDLSDLSR